MIKRYYIPRRTGVKIKMPSLDYEPMVTPAERTATREAVGIKAKDNYSLLFASVIKMAIRDYLKGGDYSENARKYFMSEVYLCHLQYMGIEYMMPIWVPFLKDNGDFSITISNGYPSDCFLADDPDLDDFCHRAFGG